MQKRTLLLWAGLPLLTVLISSVSASEWVGVSKPQRAEYNWVMHCRGCHGVNARGSKGGAPDMVGIVSQFLHTEEGRAYLVRVPGVAFVSLDDSDVAELLNWLTQHFDREHLPATFLPYSAKEVERLRKKPLISQAFNKRREILETLDDGNITIK